MENRVLEAFIKQINECQKPEIQEAIKEQVRLSSVTKGKRDVFYKLLDQSIEYLSIGTEKFFNKYPQYKEDVPKNDVKIDIARYALLMMIKNPSRFADITKHMKEIEELNKNDEISEDATKAFLEYAMAFSELEERIKKDRKHLFSKDYKEKMETLADEGVLMYFLETPDFPLLDKEITSNDILDSLLDGGMEKILITFFQMENAGRSVQIKQEDLGMTLWLIEKGAYRCAARTLFALIESEHKKAASAYGGIIHKKREYKQSAERAQEVDKLVDSIEDEWLKKAWKKTDKFYAKVWAKTPVEDVAHRNTIVHGDYDNQIIEIDKYAVAKLLLLWLNLRLIADKFCSKAEILENIIFYLPSIVLHIKNKK